MCLRRAAGRGSFARFETHIEPNPIWAGSQASMASCKPPKRTFERPVEQVAKASHKQVSKARRKRPKRTFRHSSETLTAWQWRIVPSKGSWSWLICWLWNAYRPSQAQASKTYIEVNPFWNTMRRELLNLRRAADDASLSWAPPPAMATAGVGG